MANDWLNCVELRSFRYIVHRIGKPKFIRDYTNFNKTALENELTSINWDTVLLQNNGVNEIFDGFYSRVSDVINKQSCSSKENK